MNSLAFVFAVRYLSEALSNSRRRRRLRSTGARSSSAYFLRDILLRHGDQEAQRYIEHVKLQVNRKNIGMVGARRAIASTVGAPVVGGREMQAAADDRGQPRTTMQARDDCKKKKKKNS